jgi:tetratricopeptide (TPR) repeat protein
MLLVNIAGTYEQEEDWNTAIDLHQQAYDNDPTYYKAIVSLARLKAQLGKLDEAIPLYEKALDITPNDPLRHAILGGCYLAHGDELKARAYYEEASRLDPSGTHHDDASDESEGTPAPGDYARQELAKLNATDPSKKKTDHRGWRWFSR